MSPVPILRLSRSRIICGVSALIVVIVLLVTRKPWEISPGRELRVTEFATVWLWLAGAVNAVLLGLLAAATPLWTRPADGGIYTLPRPALPRWFVIGTLAAMLVSALFGAMRLGHSFWDDEVYAMRRAISGQWRARDGGASVTFKRVKWPETLWFFEKPQHNLHSVLSRLALDGWKAVARPSGLPFREDVVRLPSLVFGVLSVGALALLFWRMGFAGAGLIAAWLAVIHPWFIRYSSELRGYSMMLCILPLCYVALIEALDGGRWRWWIAYGSGLFVLMYANALDIYPAIGLGLCGLVAIAAKWRHPAAFVQLSRFAVASLFSAMLFFQLMLPCVPQFLAYLRSTAVHRAMGVEWIANYLSFMISGMPWNPSRAIQSSYMELLPRAAAHPVVFGSVVLLTVLLAIAGLVRLIRAGRVETMVAAAFLFPAPVAYLLTRLRGDHLFEWYLLFSLPGLIGAVALGLDGCRSALSRSRPGFAAGILLVVAVLGGFFAWTTPQRTWLLTRSLQPIRESVEVTRPSLNPFAKENQAVLTAGFVGSPDPYDARIVMVRSVDELADLMKRADAEHKQLFVNLGFIVTAENREPTIMNALRDPSLFELKARLQGYEPINDRYVYAYHSGSLAGRNLNSTHGPEDPGRRKIENRYDSDGF